MTDPAAATCDHCQLSLGVWPYHRNVDGSDHRFCCYGCFIGWQVARGGGEESAAAGLLIRLGVGAFLAMNIMLFSLMLYSGGADAAQPWIRETAHYVLWVFATPAMVILGGPFFAEAARNMREGHLGAASLISIGTGAAYLFSVVVTLQGGERVYFDTATMVLGLFILGRYLEANGRARAMRNLAPMLLPKNAAATVVSDGITSTRPLSEIRTGDLMEVQPGDRIPVDGMVVDGAGFVDESWLTGESRPVEKARDDNVFAGTINLDGVITISAMTDGLESRWAAICASLHEALKRPAAVQSVTDRVAVWFVPVVLIVALLTIWFWTSRVPVDQALMNGLAVLVVACPCALGLAAPLASALSLEKLLHAGCVVRSSETVFALADIKHIAFDKTGTLTLGIARVVDVVAARGTPGDVLWKAASLESGSRHPLGRGIYDAAVQQDLELAPSFSVRAVPGRGIRGFVCEEFAAAGTARWFSEMGWPVPDPLTERLRSAEKDGLTAVCVAWGDAVRGTIILDDKVSDTAAEVVGTLAGLNVGTSIESGDGPGPVGRVAGTCGIADWRADLLPEQKADRVAEWKTSAGSVAMVGDGINDGPALLAADVGISVGNGVELATETADAVLPGNGLSSLPTILRLARHTKRVVRQNITWALSYNAVAIGLAATGYLQPVIAAALMAGSSFLVIANSMRIAQSETHEAGHRMEEPANAREYQPS